MDKHIAYMYRDYEMEAALCNQMMRCKIMFWFPKFILLKAQCLPITTRLKLPSCSAPVGVAVVPSQARVTTGPSVAVASITSIITVPRVGVSVGVSISVSVALAVSAKAGLPRLLGLPLAVVKTRVAEGGWADKAGGAAGVGGQPGAVRLSRPLAVVVVQAEVAARVAEHSPAHVCRGAMRLWRRGSLAEMVVKAARVAVCGGSYKAGAVGVERHAATVHAMRLGPGVSGPLPQQVAGPTAEAGGHTVWTDGARPLVLGVVRVRIRGGQAGSHQAGENLGGENMST